MGAEIPAVNERDERLLLSRIKALAQRILSKNAELNQINEVLRDAEHEYNQLRAEYDDMAKRVAEAWRAVEGPRNRTIECRSEIQATQTELLGIWIEHLTMDHGIDDE